MALDPAKLKPGEEQHEAYQPGRAGRPMTHYDYRHTDGQLFTCITPDLESARARRDAWLELRHTASPLMAKVLNVNAHVVL